MHLALFAASLSLICIAQAGQYPLGQEFDANSRSTPGNKALLGLSPEWKDCHHPESRGRQESDTPEMGSLSQSSSPWTEMPKCIPKENSTLTYCVYTSDVFANGRGISFFTTPSVAERVAALPAFTRKDLYDKVNIFDDPPWEIKVIPGRGRGLFATRTLYRGDRIVAATPVGVYLSDALVPDFKLGYIYLHTAFIHLPKPTQQLFLSAMAGSEGDPIMERVNTNAFSGDFEGEPHFLMYPETAVSYDSGAAFDGSPADKIATENES